MNFNFGFIRNTKYYIRYTPYFSRGAAAISTILIIAAIVSEIAIAALLASYFASQSGLGVRIVYNASFTAQAGIDDALLKISRNKNFVPNPNPYTITVGSASASVMVCANSYTTNTNCDTPATGTYEITSLGVALTKQVRMRALLYVDPTTGLVTVKSVKEIST